MRLHLGLPKTRKQKSKEAKFHLLAPELRSMPWEREKVNTDLD